MNQCLVKTLRAVVDNPNLPVLETMQQFTLDAIAFSGNNSLTDAQKLALNHFFYKVGAIGNTATYQKIKMMLIPLIGSGLSTALNDYKNNISKAVASADTTFSNGCLVYSGSSSPANVANFALSTIAANHISMVIYDASAGTDFRLSNSESPTNKIKALTITASNNKEMRVVNDPYISYTSAYRFIIGSKVDCVSGVTMRESDIYGCYYDSGIQECTVTKKEDLREINANSAGLYMTNGENGSRMKVCILGENFTSDEVDKLVIAVQELKTAFEAS